MESTLEEPNAPEIWTCNTDRLWSPYYGTHSMGASDKNGSIVDGFHNNDHRSGY